MEITDKKNKYSYKCVKQSFDQNAWGYEKHIENNENIDIFNIYTNI